LSRRTGGWKLVVIVVFTVEKIFQLHTGCRLFRVITTVLARLGRICGWRRIWKDLIVLVGGI
jgi:hypothetical protein